MAYRVPPFGISELWYPPLSPNVNNDEFFGSALSGWTRTYTPSATPIDPLTSFNTPGEVREDYSGFRPSWMRVQPSADSANYSIHKQLSGAPSPVPDGLYLVRMGFEYRLNNITNNDGTMRFALCASSAGAPDLNNMVNVFVAETDGALIMPQTQVVIGGAVTQVQMTDQEGIGDHFEYGAIIKNGTNYFFWVGTASGSWTYMQTHAYAGPPAIDRVAFIFGNTASAAPGNMIMKFDFFRYFTQKDLP